MLSKPLEHDVFSALKCLLNIELHFKHLYTFNLRKSNLIFPEVNTHMVGKRFNCLSPAICLYMGRSIDFTITHSKFALLIDHGSYQIVRLSKKVSRTTRKFNMSSYAGI